jgi:hypothetical protein
MPCITPETILIQEAEIDLSFDLAVTTWSKESLFTFSLKWLIGLLHLWQLKHFNYYNK